MEKFTYKPKGVCAQLMEFEIDNNTIVNTKIIGGCSGNLQGICRIIQGKKLEEVIQAFQGVQCNQKVSSCPDQIARALKQYQGE